MNNLIIKNIRQKKQVLFNLKIVLILLLVIITQDGFSQETIKKKVKTEALKMSKATINGDYDILVSYTHPNIIKASGGSKKLIGLIEKQMSEMETNDFIIEDVIIEEPIVVNLHKDNYHALVPKTTTLINNGQKIISKDYLFGFSDINGEKWTFVEAEKLKSAAGKKIFPNFETNIDIPNKETPRTIKEDTFFDVPEFDENAGTYDDTDKMVDTVFGLIGLGIGLVFLLLTISVIIFFIVRHKRKDNKNSTPEKIPMKNLIKAVKKVCTKCEGENDPNSKYCAFCGYAIHL